MASSNGLILKRKADAVVDTTVVDFSPPLKKPATSASTDPGDRVETLYSAKQNTGEIDPSPTRSKTKRRRD